MRIFNLIVSFSLVFVFANCSSSGSMANKSEFEIVRSYYSTWVSGAAPASSGANFFVLFKGEPGFKVESFTVNGKQLKIEKGPTEDGLLVIGRHTTPANFGRRGGTIPAFYTQNKYSGKLKVTKDGKSSTIHVDNFEKTENISMP